MKTASAKVKEPWQEDNTGMADNAQCPLSGLTEFRVTLVKYL